MTYVANEDAPPTPPASNATSTAEAPSSPPSPSTRHPRHGFELGAARWAIRRVLPRYAASLQPNTICWL